jgi:hypothetical protein
VKVLDFGLAELSSAAARGRGCGGPGCRDHRGERIRLTMPVSDDDRSDRFGSRHEATLRR